MNFISEIYWDKGKREKNQDSVSLQQVSVKGKSVLFLLVCDGIGGLEEGETASGYVAEQMTEWFYKEALDLLRRKKGRRKIERAGLRALYGCNEALCSYGEKKGIKLGTTVTLLLLAKKEYFLWHSGDTRAYRIRAKGRSCKYSEGKRMTREHTEKTGEGGLLRCIGSFSWKQPDVQSGHLERNSVWLICSDGFFRQIEEGKMTEAMNPAMLQSGKQLYGRMKEIAEYVKQRGEKDNISAVAVLID